MAATRTKKTIRLNPLAVVAKSTLPRSGLLSDSPVAARKGTTKTKAVAARPEKPKAKPSVKGTGKVVASGVLEEKKKSVKTTRNKSKDVVVNAAPAVSASQESDRSKEGRAEVAAPVLRNRPVAQVRYGDVLSVREIVPGPQADEFGFYESTGEFVSLMHLEGPLVMGGGLGFVTASILNIRKYTIFLARQADGQHKYVSLDWNGLSHLKRMAFKLGR
jgi:hypothetical protein